MVEGWSRLLDLVAEEVAHSGMQGWVVGGGLRDALVGIPPHDIDIVVDGDHDALAQRLHAQLGGSIARLSRRTIRLGPPGTPQAVPLTLDLSALHGPTLTDDLATRDLRINAMALPLTARAALVRVIDGADADSVDAASAPGVLNAALIDPLRGRDDLEARRMELASPSALSDEPGRILRAARHAAALDLQPSATFLEAAHRAAPALAALSRDRLRDEFAAIIAGANADVALALLRQTDALESICSNDIATPHTLACIRLSNTLLTSSDDRATRPRPFGDASLHEALQQWYVGPVRDGRPRIVALRWGLLLHEASAEVAAQVATNVSLSAEVRRIVSAANAALAWRARLAEAQPTLSEQRRLFALHGDAAVETLVAASICNQAYTSEQVHVSDTDASPVTQRAATILATFFADRALLIPPPLLTGADLIRALAIAPGPGFKPLLTAIRTAQLDGVITTYDEALTLAARIVDGAREANKPSDDAPRGG